MRISFTVPGDPKGYVTRTHRGKFSPRAKAYHAWLEKVKLYAVQAGWKWPKATYEHPVRVDVWPVYANKVGPDPENVRKAVVDALFPSASGGDRDVWGTVYPRQVCAEAPCVEVEVTYD